MSESALNAVMTSAIVQTAARTSVLLAFAAVVARHHPRKDLVQADFLAQIRAHDLTATDRLPDPDEYQEALDAACAVVLKALDSSQA